ncbi:hypothetical protein BJ508DRAFT_76021 [Ascobolus immersus RN42]|uniref:Uncharacterized protein n=1 Tax=Ascobolus immersus RN42 TaxID=1160509 RepID=A0A3N4HJI9_ASCIM|nr:hypothetical protein BJ508DRAFT_76021 [Ascobolus immersus RN42]
MRPLLQLNRNALTILRQNSLHHTPPATAIPSYRLNQLRFQPTQQTRQLTLLQTLLAPPLTFGGLLLALWTLKSVSLVVFQNKIIYLPYLPPYCRSEPLPEPTKRIEWKDLGHIEGGRRYKWGGGKVQLNISGTEVVVGGTSTLGVTAADPQREVLVVYFQGNAGNAPMRIPLFNDFLISPLLDTKKPQKPWKLSLLYPSFRGYWTSTGTATGWGLREDIPHLLRWIKSETDKRRQGGRDVKLVVWGQSIGSMIAAELAGRAEKEGVEVEGLILETPFTTLSDLVKEVYPQRWIPYGYLTRFLEVDWDLEEGLRRWTGEGKEGRRRKRVLVVQAEKDELVGERIGEEVRKMVGGLNVEKVVVGVRGAGHQGCVNREGGTAIARFLEGLIQRRVSDRSSWHSSYILIAFRYASLYD